MICEQSVLCFIFPWLRSYLCLHLLEYEIKEFYTTTHSVLSNTKLIHFQFLYISSFIFNKNCEIFYFIYVRVLEQFQSRISRILYLYPISDIFYLPIWEENKDYHLQSEGWSPLALPWLRRHTLLVNVVICMLFWSCYWLIQLCNGRHRSRRLLVSSQWWLFLTIWVSNGFVTICSCGMQIYA